VYKLLQKSKISKDRAELSSLYGREPTDEELAEYSEISLEDLHKSLQTHRHVLSLDAALGEEESRDMLDVLEDTNAISPEDSLMNKDLSEITQKALLKLNEREANIVRMRFGLDNLNVNRELELSQDEVNKIKKRSKTK